MRRTAAVAAAAATTLTSTSPALAADPDPGADLGTFICYGGIGDQIALIGGRTVTTPSGQELSVCPSA